jgi:hypothetical protein
VTDAEKARRFERALAHAGNTHTAADVLDRVREGRARCWPSGDSIVITEVLVFPRARVCNYWIGVGNLRECSELQPEIDAWAVEQGCSVATATARMGWLRVIKTPLGEGWRPAGIKYVKDLRHE